MKIDTSSLPTHLLEKPLRKCRENSMQKQVMDLIALNEVVDRFMMQQAYYYLFKEDCTLSRASSFLFHGDKRGALVRVARGKYKKVKEY